MVSRPIKHLLTGLIDYAGLFPPAKLDMEPAVVEYGRQRASGESWILGRFVVPASRLEEMEAALAVHHGDATAPGIWPLSVLAGEDIDLARRQIEAFDRRQMGRARAEAIELKVRSIDDVAAAVEVFDGLEVFVEIPYAEPLAPWMAALAEHGARAKIRSGGVTEELFPSVEQVANFLLAADRAGVALKATAGLHHPMRGNHRLTYEPGSDEATMHGFLNVFLGAAFLADGLPAAELPELLAETRASAFEFSPAGVAWNEHKLTADAIARARDNFAMSYGSCSFEEPVDDLRQLHLL